MRWIHRIRRRRRNAGSPVVAGGGGWLSGLTLDFKLGLRMLLKYPGFTIVGGLAMSFAILLGAVTFVLVTQVASPRIPLPDGDRIVEIDNWDTQANQEEQRILSDFLVWRQGVRSVTELGAYRNSSVNLLVGKNVGPPVNAAEITASAFRIAPDRPILGRTLVAADERIGAPPVVVLGHDLWRRRFAGDPGIIGRTVQLGEAHATVVGVMPEGFGFPIAHELWLPLRVNAIGYAPRGGPEIEVFGRLAPGASIETAQAELTALGRRAAAQQPDTHRHLQPLVAGYAQPDGEASAFMFSINLFAVLLLVFICFNVALLAFARAASRENEFVVRSAIGASRGRIVAQLFAEALVLGGVAAAVGLGAAELALRTVGVEFMQQNYGATLPFWFDLRLSAPAILYAAALTVLGAVIAGVVPARKLTRSLGTQLKQGTAGAGGVQFGGIWTAVIVMQVAFTVGFPVLTFAMQREATRVRSYDLGIPAEEYLAVGLEMDAGADSASHQARFGSALEALRQRAASEPGVTGVTFVDQLPGEYHWGRRIELDSPTGGAVQGSVVLADPFVSTAKVDVSYFGVVGAPVLAGRGFGPADQEAEARVVVVDQGFVELKLQGRNPVGRRLRFLTPTAPGSYEPGPWYQIIGVVKDLGMTHPFDRDPVAGVYLTAAPGSSGPVHMLVHTSGDPLALSPRVRLIAAEADATLRVTALQPLDHVNDYAVWTAEFWLRLTLVLTAVALLLSLAGIYSVMSFTVVRRTREIGVRVALGASPGGVVRAIFRKPMIQVGAGIVIGFILVTTATWVISGHRPDGLPRRDVVLSLGQVGLLIGFTVATLGVCLLACVVPTRRALRVQPSEALRME